MATVFISTVTGDDANDGSSKEKAVKNIARAFELVSQGDVIMAEREDDKWVVLPAKKREVE